MIVAECHSCKKVYHVLGKMEDVKRLLSIPEWEESFPCPTDLCRGRAVRGATESIESRHVIEVKLEDFYRMIQGQGSAPLKQVTELFLHQKIVLVDADPVGHPERTIVHCLTFADGTKMHFGISRLGACAHRIEEPPREIHTDTAAKGSNTD